MKAIDVIKAMCYDSALAERSQVIMFGSDVSQGYWMSMMFGKYRIKEGELSPGDYLATWQVDANFIYPFNAENAPDVVLERLDPENYDEDDREVYLYMIE